MAKEFDGLSSIVFMFQLRIEEMEILCFVLLDYVLSETNCILTLLLPLGWLGLVVLVLKKTGVLYLIARTQHEKVGVYFLGTYLHAERAVH